MSNPSALDPDFVRMSMYRCHGQHRDQYVSLQVNLGIQ